MGSIVKTIPGTLGDGLQESLNNFVPAASTNNTWTSNSNNNPYGLSFDDLKSRFGVERIMFAGLEAIPDSDGNAYDSAGKPGYYVINALTGKVDKRIRCYGSWLIQPNTIGQFRELSSNVTGDYYVVTAICTGLNVNAHDTVDSTRGYDVYVDGSLTTTVLKASYSAVLEQSSVNSNRIFSTGLSLTQGIHTIKLVKDQSGYSYPGLIEIVNSSSAITVPSGIEVINGKEITFASKTGASALNYKGLTDNSGQQYSGTKGGRVAWFRQADTTDAGIYVSKVTTITEVNQSGTVAYNSTSSDTITGLSDYTQFYANSQGNIVRVKDATSTDKMLLVPSAGTTGTLTFANDYDGVADTTLFAGNKQYRDDGTTGVTFADAESVTVELYGKVLANADHSNEEMYREIHWREFGAGRSDDFSTVGGVSGSSRSFTLDDGITTLVGSFVLDVAGNMSVDTTNGFILLTFVGTGLDAFGTFGGASVRKIVSDLPYGVHTYKNQWIGSSTWNQYIDGIFVGTLSTNPGIHQSFRIYQPKTPVLTGYKPEFAYNVLADQVLTSLPTSGLTSYNGAVDQGMIRKSYGREHVYTGASISYGIAISVYPMGGAARMAISNAADSSLTVFGANYFRTWIAAGSGSDTETIKVDGVAVDTAFSSTGGTIVGRKNTMGSLGLHTLNMTRVTYTNGLLDFLMHDYYTPIYEPATWTTNPYLDYFISGTGVGDYTKSSAVDVARKPREYKVWSTVANGTNFPGSSAELLLAGLALDKGKWLITTETTVYKANANNTALAGQVSVDGTGLKIEIIGLYASGTTVYGTVGPRNYEVNLSKRSCVQSRPYASANTDYYLHANSTVYIHARKISE